MNHIILDTKYVFICSRFINHIYSIPVRPTGNIFLKQQIKNAVSPWLHFRTYRKQDSWNETLKRKADLYSILRISPKATTQQIKTAYYKLCLIYHPDKNHGSFESQKKFAAISEAYKILGNKEERMKYDRNLVHTKFPTYKETDIRRRYSMAPSKSSYDEWTKAHYGNAFKKHQTFLRSRDAYIRELRIQEKRKLLNRHLVPILGVLLVTTLIYSSFV